MAYQEPGTRFIQVFEEQPIAADVASLPGCIIGPLYNVTDQGVASAKFDPLTTNNQTFTWPEKLVGSVVDLAGTRNGYIDSQRRELAPLVPSFWLRDGTVLTEVDDAYVSGLGQSGFTLAEGAKTGAERADIDPFIVEVNGEVFLYNQGGGLNVVQVGDKVNVNGPSGDPSGVDATVDSFSETEIRVVEDVSAEFDILTDYVRFQEDEDAAAAGAAADTVTVTSAPTAGRVLVTLGGAGAETFSGNGVAVGDFLLTGKKMVGLTAMTANWAADPAGQTDFDNVAFGINIDPSEVDKYIVKVTDTDHSPNQTYWARIVDLDTSLGTLSIDLQLTTDPSGANYTVASDFLITIYEGQVGYIEDIDSGDTVATVVVPSVFSDSATFAYVRTDTTAMTVYPDFDVLATYRALRKDLVGQVLQASSSATIKTAIGLDQSDEIVYTDELAFAAEVFALAQPTERSFFFIPVDTEPGGTTGLPENRDLDSGYIDGLNLAKSVDAYQVLVLDKNSPSTAIYDALETHVTDQSTPVEKHERRGFFYNDVPLGEHNRITGLIEPGRTVNGLSSGPTGPTSYNDATDGNTTIRDINLGDPIAFVTGAGVVAGTEVVVEFPSDFAGEYTADGATTDSDLILTGDAWPLIREFQVASASIVSSVPSVHTIVASGNPWVHVEAGDYAEGFIAADAAGLGATLWYRFPVLSVSSDGNTLTVGDDIAGDLTFAAETLEWISIIRTWGPSNTPSVRYHIDPLTKDEQVDQLNLVKSQDNRRFSTGFAQAPTMTIGTDPVGQPIQAILNPALTLVACAAKRSGLEPNDEVTNQFLGGGIGKVQFGFGHFDRGQLNELADNGYLIFAQQSESSEPYIRDMITSVTVDETARTEELVTANADYQAKTIRNTFGPRPGVKPPLINSFLLGVRHMQVDSILRNFVTDGFLVSYRALAVTQNSVNKRQVDITYTAVFPVAEKEIEFTVTITV